VNRRRAITLLALLGALDATYLLLAKLGYVGPVVCTVGHGCDTVNASVYSEFFGVPVAGIGLAGYLALMAVALAGVQPRWVDERWPDLALSLLSGIAAAFSLYLTYAEIFILRAICQWCVLSQIIILAIFGLAITGALRGAALQVGETGK
jgi:uncharacterized membrane protein